jgi:hypothetical protein
VLIEAGRNLERFAEAYERFRHDLITVPWDVVARPGEVDIRTSERLIHPKDVHVLAAALSGKCHFLLTLDRRDFFTDVLREAGLSLVIATPGEFIQRYYPLHPDYASARLG